MLRPSVAALALGPSRHTARSDLVIGAPPSGERTDGTGPLGTWGRTDALRFGSLGKGNERGEGTDGGGGPWWTRIVTTVGGEKLAVLNPVKCFYTLRLISVYAES